jgi:uncharacterized membrane protein YkoI
MNTRTKAVVAGASVVVLGGLGTSAVVASATGADLNPLGDGDLDRAEQVALDHVGEGEVTEAESEEEGSVAYEIEITRSDGTEVSVELDADHTVLAAIEEGRDDDDSDDSDDDSDDSDDDSADDGDVDGDDRALGRAQSDRAERAALAEVGRGTVTDVSAEDDVVGGQAVRYEVEVTRADGTEVDVYLRRDFAVVTTVEDGSDG